jgi:hypothetical protein
MVRESSALYAFAVATWNDVRRLALALPETAEDARHGNMAWGVKNKVFVWERPLRKGDYEALGDDAPDGPILGVRTADEGEKLALIEEDPAVFFTTPHFTGYPAILVQLDAIKVPRLKELLTEAWLVQAPKRVAAAYLSAAPTSRPGRPHPGAKSGRAGREVE